MDKNVEKYNKIDIKIDDGKISRDLYSSLSKIYNKNIEIIDNALLDSNNLIDKTNNISNYFSNKNELNIELNNILNNNIKYINDLNDNLYQTRHSCMQRIQYMESSISRLLTYVATIFLPLSFLLGFISLPIKNIPFRNNNNFIYYLLFIIILYWESHLGFWKYYFNTINFWP